MRSKLLILLVIFLFAGCIKDDLNDLIDNFEYSPNLAVPIGTVNLELGNVLLEDSNIIIDNDGALSIVYRENNIASLYVDDLLEIPTQSPISETFNLSAVALDDIVISDSILLQEIIQNINSSVANTLQQADGQIAYFPPINPQNAGSYNITPFEDFNFLVFSDGILSLTINNNLPVSIDNLTIELVNTNSGSAVAIFSFSNILSYSQETSSYNVSDMLMNNNLTMNILQFSSMGSGADPFDVASHVLIDLQDFIGIELSGSGLEAAFGEAVMPDNLNLEEQDIFNIDLDGDEELKTIVLSSCQLNYTIYSQFYDDFIAELVFPTSQLDGDTARISIDINSGGSTSGNIDLSGISIDLSTDLIQPYNQFPIWYKLTPQSSGQMVVFDSSMYINFNIELNSLAFDYIDGYAGQRSIDIDFGSIDFGIDVLSNISGGFYLQNPIAKILIDNSIGIPVDADLYMLGIGLNNSQALNAPIFSIPYPLISQLGQTIYGEIQIDNQNSDIVDFLALPPQSIEYSGSITTNPLGNLELYDNFLTAQSKVVIGLEIELPLELKTSNLTLQDTIDSMLDFEAIQIEDTSYLYIKVDNGFPFEANIDVYFLDEFGLLTDSVQFNFIEAPIVDASGRVIESVISEDFYFITNQKYENIINANQLVFKSVLTSSNNGDDIVKLYTDYKISIALGLTGTIKVEL